MPIVLCHILYRLLVGQPQTLVPFVRLVFISQRVHILTVLRTLVAEAIPVTDFGTGAQSMQTWGIQGTVSTLGILPLDFLVDALYLGSWTLRDKIQGACRRPRGSGSGAASGACGRGRRQRGGRHAADVGSAQRCASVVRVIRAEATTTKLPQKYSPHHGGCYPRLFVRVLTRLSTEV